MFVSPALLEGLVLPTPPNALCVRLVHTADFNHRAVHGVLQAHGVNMGLVNASHALQEPKVPRHRLDAHLAHQEPTVAPRRASALHAPQVPLVGRRPMRAWHALWATGAATHQATAHHALQGHGSVTRSDLVSIAHQAHGVALELKLVRCVQQELSVVQDRWGAVLALQANSQQLDQPIAPCAQRGCSAMLVLLHAQDAIWGRGA